MDIQPTNQQSISDDQELAKVLAGVTQQADNNASGLNFEETPAIPTPPVPTEEVLEAPVAPVAAFPTPAVTTDDSLEGIKNDALQELRPLVDKLNVSPEEKFDTYLLLLRSTDDKALVGPAHAAAQGIADETRRAQALLDVIKEIDYLSAPEQPTV